MSLSNTATPSDTLYTDADLAVDDDAWMALLNARVKLEAEPSRRRIEARSVILRAESDIKVANSQHKHRNISQLQRDNQVQAAEAAIAEATEVVLEANAQIAAIHAGTAELRQRRYRVLYPHQYARP